MDEDFAPYGTPARLTAEDMVRRAILDLLDEIRPGARRIVAERAHARLSAAAPGDSSGEDFARRTHAAIDAIVQVPKA